MSKSASSSEPLTERRPEILDRRREVVEHPFGSIKQSMYQGSFLMRGLANVRAEFSLTALRCYGLIDQTQTDCDLRPSARLSG